MAEKTAEEAVKNPEEGVAVFDELVAAHISTATTVVVDREVARRSDCEGSKSDGGEELELHG
jgi:hypothetical protein